AGEAGDEGGSGRVTKEASQASWDHGAPVSWTKRLDKAIASIPAWARANHRPNAWGRPYLGPVRPRIAVQRIVPESFRDRVEGVAHAQRRLRDVFRIMRRCMPARWARSEPHPNRDRSVGRDTRRRRAVVPVTRR